MTRPGRPAGPAADTEAVVLTAALDLLLTEGAGALTPQRLHAVTGVARTTIYRHWPTPRDVLAALIAVAPHEPLTPSGDPVADLHTEVDLLCDRLRDKPVAAFLRALVTASSADPSCTELRHRYVADLLEPFRAALRALAFGDEAAVEEAASAIVAPLLVDALLLDRPVDRERAHRAAADVLARVTT
ncbi:TetR family transcriptional regulator [Nocardia otitidiscaviarum]|uniref:TetR family transcriptional regulator n=1 Tax=Nocardia otitidiscaviarum TaxID=1823 RepID=A0A516NM55_9NOCA|nr:TetR/AcrR family transcriptional regulator C-terminal ligand-binding domain-containing protein [Nocardia otitidiscaviarum]MCP9624880.1 TetR/AcrR family transcriptional regulator C-terminal ligand-binding domain-containing protein [Nocardia otitidiscaviarum]QDP79978.1 TetR family transcriptional regulator [Nocardia otitidiscaviarum]